MTENPVPQPPADNRQPLSLLNDLLISGMLTCLAFILAKLLPALYPAWTVRGLPLMAFLVSLEGLIAHRSRAGRPKVIETPFLSTAAEWVLILILTKLAIMLQGGLAGIWQEILSWQQGFFRHFFEIQYGLVIFILFLIWGITRLYIEPINQLEEDKNLMAQEKLGYAFIDRQQARRSLIGLIFTIGSSMIGLTVLLNGEIEFMPLTETPTRNFVSVLLIYFVLAFIFMALNQYAIMKARWFFNDIEVNADLSKRWLRFTLVFISIVIVVSVFLPTGFAIGFYPILSAILQGLIFIVGVLQFIVMAPIAFLLTLFSSLLSTEESVEQIRPVMPEFNPDTTEAVATLPLWDVVKSVLFWLVFIGVIVFAVLYYIRNRRGLKDFFRFDRLRAWLRDFWAWIKRGAKQLGAFTAETAQKGIQGVRLILTERRVKLPSLADLVKGISPRQAVILTYLDWVRWNKENGLSRRESQTPAEYAAAIRTRWPEVEAPLKAFTNAFIQARYTRQAIEKPQVDAAQNLLKDLKALIRQAEANPDNLKNQAST
ncbi:MAG: DUF4129 domain-containing protein [Chloroflexota bacterium]|nr:DUF4129 domain-containing protein [Chloroflexota bacterium]